MTLNELLFRSASLPRTQAIGHRPDGSVILMAPSSRTDWDIALSFQSEHAAMTPEEIEAKYNEFDTNYRTNDWTWREHKLFELSCSDRHSVPASEYVGILPDGWITDLSKYETITSFCGRPQVAIRYINTTNSGDSV